MGQEQYKQTAYVYWKKLANHDGTSDGKRVSYEESTTAGKVLLKQALFDVYGIHLEKEELAKGKYGKPYLKNHPEVHYNISHSGCYTICAVSQTPLGIDIQEKRSIAFDKVGKKIFTDEEYRKFLRSEDKQDVFFRQWVRIESYLKWTGEGITRKLKELPMDGWHQFLPVDKNYICAVWSERPLRIILKEQ